MKANLSIEKPAVLGEGPWWDVETQKLWWIDGLSENGAGDDLHCFDPATGEDKCWHIGKHLGVAIPTKDGRVIMNLQDGIYYFDPATEQLTEISDLEREIENNRINDGKVDSHGRLWFGSMSMTANQPEREFEVTGSFYHMEPDGTVVKHFDGVGISNGLIWNDTETVMYYVDSTTHNIFAFDFDAEKGEISNRRVVITIDEADGVPDGMTIDAEGKLWVAHFGGWRVSRVDPELGKVIDEIRLPCEQVSCCCFGGENLDELYITTASIGLSKEQRKAQPYAGCMFKMKPGVSGTPLYRF